MSDVLSSSEMSRAINIIKKLGGMKSEADRGVADAYKSLYDIKKALDKEMAILKGELIRREVREYFYEEERKVIVKDGAIRTHLDPVGVAESLSLGDFLKVCSVTETSLKEKFPSEADIIIQTSKIEDGYGNPTVQVGKITLKEMKEMAEKGATE